jgi:hypothetical protein
VGDSRKELSASTSARLDEIWTETIDAEFGYSTYQHLAKDLRVGSRT